MRTLVVRLFAGLAVPLVLGGLAAMGGKKRQVDKDVLLKEYEACSQELLASKTRFFQVEAIVLSMVWGGFALFVTQTTAGSVDHMVITSVAAAGAIAFSVYWVIAAARFRLEETVIEHRMLEIEGHLQMHLRSDLFLDFARRKEEDVDLLPGEEQERFRLLENGITVSPLTRAFCLGTRYPLSMFVGFGGVMAWLAAVGRSFATHYGWL